MHPRQHNASFGLYYTCRCVMVSVLSVMMVTSGYGQSQKGADWYNLGIAHAEGGKVQEAIRCFQRAIQEDPLFVDAWIRLASQYEHQQQPQRALHCYQHATEAAPEHPAAWMALGEFYVRADNLPQALEAFRRAMNTADGQNIEVARRSYAETLFRIGDIPSARREFESFLQDFPSNASVWAMSAELALTQNRLDDAAAACRQAIKLMPENPEFWHNLGVIELRRGHPADASHAFARAALQGTRSTERLMGLGIALAREGRLDDAIVVFKEVVRADPRSAVGWFNLGEAYRQHGWLQDAANAYRRALALRPDYAPATEALQKAEEALATLNTNAIYVIEPHLD